MCYLQWDVEHPELLQLDEDAFPCVHDGADGGDEQVLVGTELEPRHAQHHLQVHRGNLRRLGQTRCRST